MTSKFRGSAKERRALSSYIKLSRAASSAELEINRHLSEHGLTISQFGVLEALYHLGSMVQTQLAEKILKSTGNMTLVIDNLCKRALVERVRDEADRRFYQIHLTKKGSELIEKIFPKHLEGVVDTFSVLSSEEQTQLAKLCRKLGLKLQEQHSS